MPHSALRERRLGDESVFFDGYSGETHYLDGLAGAIMRRVFHGGAVGLQGLSAELADLHPHDHDVAITPDIVRDTALALQRLGLLRVDDEP